VTLSAIESQMQGIEHKNVELKRSGSNPILIELYVVSFSC